MLDTLTLIERRDLPAIPEPRPAVKAKMLALAALIDVPVNLWLHRTGIVPSGCWWLPQSHLAIYGTACRRPLMFEEVRDISSATGLSGIIVRGSDTADRGARVSFDVYHAGAWYVRHLLWTSLDGGTGWLLPDLGQEHCLRLSPWGVDIYCEPPYLDQQDRLDGIARGAAYLSSSIGHR